MANESLFNEHWYRVADLKPQLRNHATLTHHRYRGKDWWVIRDPVASRHHRLSEPAYRLVKRMDGRRTVEDIWDHAVQTLGDDVPTQSDLITLLGQLHQSDLLQTDVSPDAEELFRRQLKRRKSKRRQSYHNPLFLRFSMFDPDGLLNRLTALGRWATSPLGLVLSGLTIVTGVLLASSHFSQITAYAEQTLLLPQNILLMLFVFPLMKALHELGHGLVVKKWGGEVHDMGIMLLVLLPIPYVDASDSAVFRHKSQRIAVSAAGIIVELVLASLGLFVWLLVEPGLVKRVAFDVMLIGGVSSLFFNGNPLMRFDGYYMLMDWIEIPNLAQRSKNYLGHLTRAMLLGSSKADANQASVGEKAWFVGYGISAYFYRLVVLLTIAFYLGSEFFLVGVALGAWTVASQLIFPFFKGTFRMLQQSRLRGAQFRAFAAGLVLLGAPSLLVLGVPVPMTTSAEGVVWLQDESIVRADTDCFVNEVLVESGSTVAADTPLFICTDLTLTTRQQLLDNQYRGLRYEYQRLGLRQPVQRNYVTEDLRALNAERELNKSRVKSLVVKSPVDGVYVVQDEENLVGRFFPQGQTVGYVINAPVMAIRTVVPQDRVDLVRQSTQAVQVRFVDNVGVAHAAAIDTEIPASTNRLPTPALGSQGGGDVMVDPTEATGTLALQDVYIFDISTPQGLTLDRIGGRAYVRFDHGSETLSEKWTRQVRLLFLRQFDV